MLKSSFISSIQIWSPGRMWKYVDFLNLEHVAIFGGDARMQRDADSNSDPFIKYLSGSVLHARLSLLQPSRKYTSKQVTKEMSKEIHAKAAPLIQWLKEAEEESSEDEDGEGSGEEVEVISCRWSECC